MGQITRRRLLAAGGLLAAPRSIAQQPAKRFRIGLLAAEGEALWKPAVEAFLAGLRDRGYEVGQNLVVDFRYAAGDRSRLPGLADDLIARKPDVLVGSEVSSLVMKSKTSTVPIVLLNSADPVGAGLVKSLARPGTNVTGMAGQLFSLVAKQVDLLTEFVPKMTRVALLNETWPPRADNADPAGRPDPWEVTIREIARAKALTPLIVRAGDSESLRKAFAILMKERADGLVIAHNSVIISLESEIVEGVRRLHLPAVAGLPSFVERGVLMSHGIKFSEVFRYAAKFVDLVLKGAKPADLPIEQVSQFQLVINRATAHELGLKVPQSILVRADRVIE